MSRQTGPPIRLALQLSDDAVLGAHPLLKHHAPPSRLRWVKEGFHEIFRKVINKNGKIMKNWGKMRIPHYGN
jgi:hypothetical protein